MTWCGNRRFAEGLLRIEICSRSADLRIQEPSINRTAIGHRQNKAPNNLPNWARRFAESPGLAGRQVFQSFTNLLG